MLSLVIFGQDMCVAMCYLLYFSPGPTGEMINRVPQTFSLVPGIRTVGNEEQSSKGKKRRDSPNAQNVTLWSSRKSSYSPHRRDWKFLREEGVSKTK